MYVVQCSEVKRTAITHQTLPPGSAYPLVSVQRFDKQRHGGVWCSEFQRTWRTGSVGSSRSNHTFLRGRRYKLKTTGVDGDSASSRKKIQYASAGDTLGTVPVCTCALCRRVKCSTHIINGVALLRCAMPARYTSTARLPRTRPKRVQPK